MPDVSENLSIWLFYIASMIGFLGIFWRVMRMYIPWAVRVIVICTLFVLLATPVAVPETQYLAPAWLVAAFEFALNRETVAQASIKPVITLLLISYAALLAIYLVRRKSAKSADSAKPNSV